MKILILLGLIAPSLFSYPHAFAQITANQNLSIEIRSIKDQEVTKYQFVYRNAARTDFQERILGRESGYTREELDGIREIMGNVILGGSLVTSATGAVVLTYGLSQVMFSAINAGQVTNAVEITESYIVRLQQMQAELSAEIKNEKMKLPEGVVMTSDLEEMERELARLEANRKLQWDELGKHQKRMTPLSKKSTAGLRNLLVGSALIFGGIFLPHTVDSIDVYSENGLGLALDFASFRNNKIELQNDADVIRMKNLLVPSLTVLDWVK